MEFWTSYRIENSSWSYSLDEENSKIESSVHVNAECLCMLWIKLWLVKLDFARIRDSIHTKCSNPILRSVLSLSSIT